MDCYYYIKLPKGGEIRVPASFKTMSDSEIDKLKGYIDNYKKGLINSKEDLITYIKDNTGLGRITFNIVDRIIKDNSEISKEDLNVVVEQINKASEDKIKDGELVDEALRKAIYKDSLSIKTEDGN
jgi:hypothetical protein